MKEPRIRVLAYRHVDTPIVGNVIKPVKVFSEKNAQVGEFKENMYKSFLLRILR